MNKTTFENAAACLLALHCGGALAQNITLAGIVDTAARYVDNEGRPSVKSLVSGSNSTSRLTFRGSEDLGGGLAAAFHLEHGLLLDAGAQASATQFWDRRATVSLTHKSIGEVRAGRDFVPSYSNWSRFDPFGYVGVAGSNNFVNATPLGPVRSAFSTSPNTTVRSSNAVQWLLPGELGGLEGGIMVAAGEGGTAAAGQHKLTGVRLGYAAGPFVLTAATTQSQNDLTAGARFKDTAVGGSFDMRVLRLSAAWRKFALGSAAQKNLLVGAVMPLGAGEIKLSWNKADLAGRVGNTVIDANDASQIGLGYVHNLSKRTAVYATLARINNKGAASFVVPGGAAGLAGGASSTGTEVGIRHVF